KRRPTPGGSGWGPRSWGPCGRPAAESGRTAAAAPPTPGPPPGDPGPADARAARPLEHGRDLAVGGPDRQDVHRDRALRDIAMTSWGVALGRRGSGGRGGADQPGLVGDHHELGAVAGAQLDHGAAHMGPRPGP